MTVFPALFIGLFFLSIPPAEAGSLRKPKAAQKNYEFKDGDIVFQGNAGPQSDAVRAATDSPFTHCGVVFKHDGKWMVMEAIQPVQITPLDDFIDRSLPNSLYAMRLKEVAPALKVEQAKQWASKQAGLPYDLKFRWDDEALYCSEFVWKLYEEAGVRLCDTRTFSDYNLKAPVVKQIIDQRYGDIDKLPLNEPVVAPSDLAASPLLMEVPEMVGKKRP